MAKKVKIDEELYEEVKKVAEKKGVTIKDLVEHAVRLYLFNQENISSEDEIKNVKVIKNWRVRFDTRCAVCGKDIKAGEWAVREILELEDGRKINKFYHYTCYHQLNDPKMAKLWVKQRELEVKVKALEKEYKELLDKVLMLNIMQEIHEISQEIIQALRSLYDVAEDKEKFQERLDELGALADKWREKLETLEAIEKLKRRKKKEVQIYESKFG